MSGPSLRRAGERMQTMPYGALILCLVLFVVQLASWPILFMLGMGLRDDGTTPAILQVPMILWMLLPAGSIYGLYLVLRRESAGMGETPRALGFIANGLYLLFGVFTWLTALFGGA